MEAHGRHAKGGRPTKKAKERRETDAQVAAGKQSTLNFKNVTVTVTGGTFNVFSSSTNEASRKRKASTQEDAEPSQHEETNEDEEEVAEAQLPAKRRAYSSEVKKRIFALLERKNGNKAATVRMLKGKRGYETVSERVLRRWVKEHKAGTATKKKTGRAVNTTFEAAVLSNLVYTVLEKAPDTLDAAKHAHIVANVAHSYLVIKQAAQMARQLPQFAENETVQNLKFSNKWVVAFLQRCALRRRRVTATEKELPPVPVVRERMAEIQSLIKDNNFLPVDVISADETGIFFGAPPKNQYVPDGARGCAPESDDKARFTALMWGTASGFMGPPFVIVKCTVNKADMSGVRVLDTILEELGGAACGWEKKLWSREIELKTKGILDTKKYVRPYLFNPGTLSVITVQHKAWMDSVGLAMWADTQVGPWAKSTGRKKLIVWDNCGPHNVPAIKAVFEEHELATCSLPPKMTDILQVMDLVVNGPLKAAIRRDRCEQLFAFFIQFKGKCALELMKPLENRVMPTFTPPKPKLIDGLRSLIKACALDLSKETFQDGLRRSFVAVGLAPNEQGAFTNYASHSRSRLSVALAPADSPDEDSFVLGDVAAEVELEVRPEEEEAEDGDDAADDEGVDGSD